MSFEFLVVQLALLSANLELTICECDGLLAILSASSQSRFAASGNEPASSRLLGFVRELG